jgi:hypothetical protein
VCVDVVGVERSAFVKISAEVCGAGGVDTGGTEGVTVGAAAGAETVALEVIGIAADLGILWNWAVVGRPVP